MVSVESESLPSCSSRSIHESEDVCDCWVSSCWSSRSRTQGHRDLVDRTKEEEGMIRLICGRSEGEGYGDGGMDGERDSSDGLECDLIDSMTLLCEERLTLMGGDGVQEGGE